MTNTKSQTTEPSPTDKDLEALIKPLWLAEKPSVEAQGIRAELSTAVDDGRYPQWALDYVPGYVWDLIDIAAQRGIDSLGHAMILGPTEDGKTILLGQAIAQTTKGETDEPQS